MIKLRITYLKFGISDRFLSSKVEFRRLDCIGSCGARTKYQHIFLNIYMHKIILRKTYLTVTGKVEKIKQGESLPESTSQDFL